MILARVILSWIRPRGYNQLYAQISSVVYGLTEPILAPIRSLLPSMGMLDISPLIALVLLRIARGIFLEFIRTVL